MAEQAAKADSLVDEAAAAGVRPHQVTIHAKMLRLELLNVKADLECDLGRLLTEAKLIRWAKTVSGRTIRERGDREARQAIEGVREAEKVRSLTSWYYDDGRPVQAPLDAITATGAQVWRTDQH